MKTINKLHSHGKKPKGFFGKLIGICMNLFHKNVYKYALDTINIEISDCLDLGCGGGKLIKLMSEKFLYAKIYGLDHSQDMLELAKQTNKHLIDEKIVELIQGTPEALPFHENSFDLVMASETIQYWQNVEICLKEVKRVLKPESIFMILNRYPKEGSETAQILQFKDHEDYKQKLNAAGFRKVSIDLSQKNWIFATAIA